MGVLIHMSDGATVGLSGEPDGILGSIASALDQQRATDEQGKVLPKGFLVFTEPRGTQVG